MFSRIRKLLEPAADETGIALVSVVLVSLVLMLLVVLTITHEEQADTQSARDRNFDLALSVAEAGVQQGIAKIQASGGGPVPTPNPFTGSTPQGTYTVTMTRASGTYTVESRGSVGSPRLGRKRVVKVTMSPPSNFPFALFSNTSIDLKNNDDILVDTKQRGDVWANNSINIALGTVIEGAVTAANGWIDMENNTEVGKELWSGGFNAADTFGLRMGSGAKIKGNAKVSAAGCSAPEVEGNYRVLLNGTGTQIDGNLTRWGPEPNPGAAASETVACTLRASEKTIPPFSYNSKNYNPPPVEYVGAGAVAAFQANTPLANLQGTYYVWDSAPSQTNRIILTGATVIGDTTIITNAPIFTNSINDTGTAQRVFVMIDFYAPPAGSSCDVNSDASECAIHLKNNFRATCETAVLAYAPNGPVAIKNNANDPDTKNCGAVFADSILMKNNQTLQYDSRIDRIVGFGAVTFEVSRWEERAATS